MKNIHILPKKSFNQIGVDNYGKTPTKIKIATFLINKNIYITSDEEIKEGDWFYSVRELIEKAVINYPKGEHFGKIILTTDQDLIKDGVQAIDDTFLEWFVKNPSCEEVELVYDYFQVNQNNPVLRGSTSLVKQHKIIIPKEESLGYICPQTKKQCDDECCVSAEDCHIKSGIGILSDSKQDEMVGIEFYKTADKVISVNRKHNMKYKTVLNISIKGEDKHKNIFKVKSKYYKLNNEEKETLLKGLLFWARQEINNLHPEQE